MATIITTPEGEQIIIEGTKICRSSSPQVCYEERPEIIQLIISEAWHNGWQVKQAQELEKGGL